MGPKEYTLDDFYALPLDKLDRYVCLKPCGIELPREGDVLESSSDEDDDEEDDDEDDSSDEEDGEEGSLYEEERVYASRVNGSDAPVRSLSHEQRRAYWASKGVSGGDGGDESD